MYTHLNSPYQFWERGRRQWVTTEDPQGEYWGAVWLRQDKRQRSYRNLRTRNIYTEDVALHTRNSQHCHDELPAPRTCTESETVGRSRDFCSIRASGWPCILQRGLRSGTPQTRRWWDLPSLRTLWPGRAWWRPLCSPHTGSRVVRRGGWEGCGRPGTVPWGRCRRQAGPRFSGWSGDTSSDRAMIPGQGSAEELFSVIIMLDRRELL